MCLTAVNYFCFEWSHHANFNVVDWLKEMRVSLGQMTQQTVSIKVWKVKTQPLVTSWWRDWLHHALLLQVWSYSSLVMRHANYAANNVTITRGFLFKITLLLLITNGVYHRSMTTSLSYFDSLTFSTSLFTVFTVFTAFITFTVFFTLTVILTYHWLHCCSFSVHWTQFFLLFSAFSWYSLTSLRQMTFWIWCEICSIHHWIINYERSFHI